MYYGVFLFDRDSDGSQANPVGMPGRQARFTDRDGASYTGTLIKSATTWTEASQFTRRCLETGETPNGQSVPQHGVKIFELTRRPHKGAPIQFA